MEKTAIFDIDNTILRIPPDRLELLHENPVDWDRFYSLNFDNDEPIHEICDTIQAVKHLFKVVFYTGRLLRVGFETKHFIQKYCDIDNPNIYFRTEGDPRPDEVVKVENILQHYQPSDIAFVFDDNQAVVDRWLSLGVLCLQVHVPDPKKPSNYYLQPVNN
ncbi:MAG: hypothetical protein PHR53_02485 [Bacteroidales bacterium]|nr:hypothetical protein [Bacteroidales bacterium]